jgi:(2Fe-2S) ferredoxin
VKKLFVCTNYRANPTTPSCAARGSKVLLEQARVAMQEQNVDMPIEEIQCMGYCEQGPNMRLAPGGEFFHKVEISDINRIVKSAKQFLKSD